VSTHRAQEENRTKAAAAGFIAVAGLLAGGAGLIIAALAVGVERTWNARSGGMAARASRQRQSLADLRAWLAKDAADRAAWREARRRWWADGADPAKEPPRPSTLTRLGAWTYRRYARARIGAHEFRQGFRDGWQAAAEVRRRGGGFRDIATARPAVAEPSRPERKETPAQPAADATPPAAPAGGGAQPGERGVVTPKDGPGKTTEKPVVEKPAEKPTAEKPAVDTQPKVNTTNGGTPTMATATSQVPQGETNLDLTDIGLTRISTRLNRLSELVDQIAAEKDALRAEVAVESERVAVNGGTAETRQALDAALALIAQLDSHVGGVSESATEAADQTQAARAGLAPARDAQDALHSAGARGEFVSTATSD
jgi:hypothetical protein